MDHNNTKVLRIQEVLKELQDRENIDIIYACESGSRAWGFESEDSDYDIRFVYRRRIEDYFTVYNFRDTIDRNKGNIETSEFIRSLESEELDFVGWDITKVMKLISSGNPALAEWLQSTIVYMVNPDCYEELKKYSHSFFKSKAGIYHYVNMAYKNWKQYIANVPGDVITKKYLYILRPIFACRFIQVLSIVPPIEFREIYNNKDVLEDSRFSFMRCFVKELIAKKKAGKELGRGPHHSDLDMMIDLLISEYTRYGLELDVHELKKEDYDKINNTLRYIVMRKEGSDENNFNN